MACWTPAAFVMALVAPGRQRGGRVDPCVRARVERALVAGGPGPAGVLGESKGPGGDGHHEQQRGPALAERLAAHLPAGERRGQPPPVPGEPVTGSRRGRQQAQRDDGPARQREGRGEREHRVDRGAHAAARGVAAQLPAGQDRQHDEREVSAGPGSAHDRGLPAAPDPCFRHRGPSAEQRARASRRRRSRDRERHGDRVEPGARRAARPAAAEQERRAWQLHARRFQWSRGGQQASEPDAGQGAHGGGDDAERDHLGRGQPDELPAGGAAGADQRRLPLALAGQEPCDGEQRSEGEHQQLERADHEQRPGDGQVAGGSAQHRRQARGQLHAAEHAGAQQRLLER